MRDLLVALSLVVVMWIVFVVAAAFVLRWRLHHANRVSPHARSDAPLTWLVSPSRPARLHRRLRSDMRGLELAVPRSSPTTTTPSLSVAALRHQLDDQAAALDHMVVLASHQPRAQRRQALDELEAQIESLEGIAARLTRLHRIPETTPSLPVESPTPDALDAISRQVELLESAHEEVTALDRGLVRPPSRPDDRPVNPQSLPSPP